MGPCMDSLDYTFDNTNYYIPDNELPYEKTEVRVQLEVVIDKESLLNTLIRKSNLQPEDFLSEPEVYIDDAVNNTIVITGYAPNNNYNVQGILDVVLLYDNGATLI